MISYAQNFEDVMLRRVFRDRKDGFYIDVGAMDPVVDSVTKFFYDEGWSGVNIEPNDCFYRKLLDQRPRDINLKLALGDHEESRALHVFEEYGTSTFDDSNRDQFAKQGHEPKDKMARISTLAAVCRDFVKQEIDFLKIDCEGWESAVIKGADWDRFRPLLVLVEATAPGNTNPTWSEWEPYLIENAHYEMAYFDGLNRFYIRREYANLRCHFESPPNVFDNFTTYTMHMLEAERDALQGDRDRLGAQIGKLITENQSLNQQAAYAADLEKRCQILQTELLNTRLWVGRLSQELAASRR